ncbi:MAG: DUF6787 family protein [Planctomycetota bacterium]|nr:DUF6787 family protein [Planctomycetota bacterium]MEC8769835.1 DUF6787 family protein [Planctomycetota bacterium]
MTDEKAQGENEAQRMMEKHPNSSKRRFESNFQFLMVMLTFSLNGPLALWVSGPVLEAVGIHRDSSSPWVFWPLRILVMTPTYQLLLIVTGTILGQRHYFWPRFMKRLRWIGLFRRFE